MASSWYSTDTVAVVTGANRGIGFEIVRQLAEQGLTVVLTARDKTKGQAAVDDLRVKGRVVFHELDASDPKSVVALAAWLKSEYGGLDILVNNAGVQPADLTYESAKVALETNYYGVKRITSHLIPLMKASSAGARIVQMSSKRGQFERLQSESVKEIFRDEDKYTEELGDSLVAEFLEDFKAGRAGEKWQKSGIGQIYDESKMFLNVYSIALAKSLAAERKVGHEIFLASVCPGITVTDMLKGAILAGRRPPGVDVTDELKAAVASGGKLPEGCPLKTPAEGADTAVWLALLPSEEWQGKTGKLFYNRAAYSFGEKTFDN